MTVGERARLFNDRLGIGADLVVVPMAQYRRAMRYGDTGLGWVPISPNLRDAEALSLYADVGLVEGAEVSVGRGTAMPFRVVGAPWIDAQALARELNALDTGAIFRPTRFVPAEGPHRGTLCAGVTIQRSSRPGRPGRIGLALALVLHRRYPTHFRIEAIQRRWDRGWYGPCCAMAAPSRRLPRRSRRKPRPSAYTAIHYADGLSCRREALPYRLVH